MATIKIKIGADAPLEFTVTDGGVVVDLTGGTLDVRIAKSTTATAIYSDSFTSFTDAVNGIHDEVIPAATTATWTAGNYYLQARFTDSAGKLVTFDFSAVV